MSNVLIAVVPSLLLFVSEVLAFVPIKYNGIVHALYDISIEIAKHYNIKVIPNFISSEYKNEELKKSEDKKEDKKENKEEDKKDDI